VALSRRRASLPGRVAVSDHPALWCPDFPLRPIVRTERPSNPSCWPPRFAVAPVADYSALDTWRSLLHVDCSAFRTVRPVLVTDLTRCSTLSALRRSRIAPRSTFAPVLRTDCSAFSTQSFRAVYGLLRTRHLTFRAAHGLLRARLFPLCTAHGLLRARSLTLREGQRIAPYADTLRPRVAHGLLRAQHFKLRTGHRLLCARHLTVRSDYGYLRALHSAPCVDRGCLRAQHLEFCAGPGLLLARHLSLRTVHRLLRVRRLPLICCLQITPHPSLSGPVLIADYSVFNTYAPRWDLPVTLTQSPQVKTFRFT